MLDIVELTKETCHISSTDVTAVTPQVIAATFEEIVHLKCIWEQLYRDNRDILNKPGYRVHFPGATANNAFSIGIAECTDITTLSTTVGMDAYRDWTIDVTKVGGFFSVSREAIKFAMRDVLKDNIYETGLQYKEAIDDMAYNNLMFGQNVIATLETWAGSSGDVIGTLTYNVIEITSISPASSKASIQAVDYCLGTVYFGPPIDEATTIWYREAGRPGLCVHASRPGSTGTGITAWGLLQAKAALIAQGRDPDVAVMSYSDLPNLLYDDKVNFLDASAYTSHEPLYNAEIGKLWGLKIITESRKLPQGVAVVVDVDRMGYDVHKEELRSYREDVYKRDAVYYYFYAERGFGVTDTLAVCKVVGGDTDYPSTHPVN